MDRLDIRHYGGGKVVTLTHRQQGKEWILEIKRGTNSSHSVNSLCKVMCTCRKIDLITLTTLRKSTRCHTPLSDYVPIFLGRIPLCFQQLKQKYIFLPPLQLYVNVTLLVWKSVTCFGYIVKLSSRQRS